jgi:hypothetical protein
MSDHAALSDRGLWQAVYLTAIEQGKGSTTAKTMADMAVKSQPKK